ncbi:TRAP transporter small permease subunit [Candidatus Thiodiazotropha sp. CDECU1]|uniref:TRAP transporter small permease subunit n=1 Tax=Candidatus Thiodiazotropha sp. CDECU1 TaxID=3065865 RepID=UPI002930C894|nr:TRAP transporter small permease subunit [Candidatus Thiodiazotropha sp. CDECU1]
MPEISFVLPHWLYWSGLILFPLLAMVLFRKAALKQSTKPLSLSLGYFLLIVGGIFGVHRLYLKSFWALAFISLFISLLVVNVEVRSMRDDLSAAQNGVKLAEFRVQRGQKAVEKGRRNAEQRLSDAKQKLTGARLSLEEAQQGSENWSGIAQILGGGMLLLLLIDLVLMPKLIRQRNQIEKLEPDEGFHCPVVEEEHEDRFEPLLINRVISHINGVAGEFVAYWSVIAVFVYYYEVIVRYVFNSPTNWAHESMFLMFGMQYLIAGGFVLREGAHVRVDVIYNHFSNRAKAMVDVVTSIFFFIFMLTLLMTGWTFFYDSYEVNEVSISEWGIQYWPIKLALSIGALLLLIQGIAQLIKDILVVIKPDTVSLDAEVRPEG